MSASPVPSPGSRKFPETDLPGERHYLEGFYPMVRDGSFRLQPGERHYLGGFYPKVRDGSSHLQPGERLSWEQPRWSIPGLQVRIASAALEGLLELQNACMQHELGRQGEARAGAQCPPFMVTSLGAFNHEYVFQGLIICSPLHPLLARVLGEAMVTRQSKLASKARMAGCTF